MPSPVGHALGGLLAGWLVDGCPAPPRDGAATAPGWWPAVRVSWSLTVLGMLPDIDLLFGTHSTYTHSAGAVAAIGAAAVLGRRLMASPGVRATVPSPLAAAAAYASHLLFDWLGTDTSPPVGIMAFWPVTQAFYKAPVSWFLPVSRELDSPTFWIGVPLAVATELTILGPATLLVARWRRRRRSATDAQ